MEGTYLAGRPCGGVAGAIVRVLGCFQVEIGDRLVSLPAQAQRVVGYLAVTGKQERRDQLAGKLWSYSSQRRADANLRTALWRIRSAGPGLIESSHAYVGLAEDVDVDLHLAVEAARCIIDDPTLTSPVADRLWEDDVLPSWDEDWLVIERERARQLRIHSLEALSRVLVEQRRFAKAIDVALAAIAAEPVRESAHAALIRAHLAEGNLGEARRQLASFGRIMQRELGLGPSAALVEEVNSAAHRAQAR